VWGGAPTGSGPRRRTNRVRACAPGTGNAARALAGAQSIHYDGWSSFKRLTACAPPLVAKSGRPMRLALTPEVRLPPLPPAGSELPVISWALWTAPSHCHHACHHAVGCP